MARRMSIEFRMSDLLEEAASIGGIDMGEPSLSLLAELKIDYALEAARRLESIKSEIVSIASNINFNDIQSTSVYSSWKLHRILGLLILSQEFGAFGLNKVIRS
ncbi:uncharacterized protein [Argopecten irradians]|uniref:uncharacterized protein n=1 Tax=Argopecten irradians TaxID=31199 RepID=UPI0037166A37